MTSPSRPHADRTRRRRPRAATLALSGLALTALLAVGCSSDDDTSADTSTTVHDAAHDDGGDSGTDRGSAAGIRTLHRPAHMLRLLSCHMDILSRPRQRLHRYSEMLSSLPRCQTQRR